MKNKIELLEKLIKDLQLATRESFEAKQEVNRLQTALRFYAGPWTWARVAADAMHMGATGGFNFNNMYGEIARKALEKKC